MAETETENIIIPYAQDAEYSIKLLYHADGSGGEPVCLDGGGSAGGADGVGTEGDTVHAVRPGWGAVHGEGDQRGGGWVRASGGNAAGTVQKRILDEPGGGGLR